MPAWLSFRCGFDLGSAFFNSSGALVDGISGGILGSRTGINRSLFGGFDSFSGFVFSSSTSFFDSLSGFIGLFLNSGTGVFQSVSSFLTGFFDVLSRCFRSFFSVIVIVSRMIVVMIVGFFTTDVSKGESRRCCENRERPGNFDFGSLHIISISFGWAIVSITRFSLNNWAGILYVILAGVDKRSAKLLTKNARQEKLGGHLNN